MLTNEGRQWWNLLGTWVLAGTARHKTVGFRNLVRVAIAPVSKKLTVKSLQSNMVIVNLIFYLPSSSPIKFCAFLILTSPWIWAELWTIIFLGVQSKLWIDTYEEILLCLQLVMNLIIHLQLSLKSFCF